MYSFLEKASAMYYAGSPIISDEEFDALAKQYNYEEVGHTVTDGIPHLYRMYSLQKVFNLDECKDKYLSVHEDYSQFTIFTIYLSVLILILLIFKKYTKDFRR